MLTTSVPSYILTSGFAAQRSRQSSGAGGRRLSQASDTASVCSSAHSLQAEHDDELLYRAADPADADIKEVLGYVHTPPCRMARGYSTPRLVHF
ncbi:hypothetical protein H4R18_000317 [Coemansia javaensis]|uniref:Uncharacterized protein n=1 Tax=Coemansia javaensis TaxID=2761396 RepID=A0A9W8HH47_9FUNG|nr:hypothetical protein H4R18_000317 [Coemansia javaensis]